LWSVAYGNGTFVVVGESNTILQTVPSSGGTPLELENPRRDGDQFSFEFLGELGATYVVEAATDLGGWSTLGTVTCTVSPTIYADLAPPNVRRFYRVRRQ
jgi:hypothetical protein